MSATANKAYKHLIDRFPLRPIKDDAHLNAAMEVVRELVSRKDNLTPDECDYHAVLLQLIKTYEDNDSEVQAFMAEVE